jgi:hypothetical protein
MKVNKLFLTFFILGFILLLFFISDIETLKHINQDYLTKYPDPSSEIYALQKTLATLDQTILDTIMALIDHNITITQTIKEIDSAFEQFDEKIRGKDLNRESEEVLALADDLKARLTKIKKQIINAKDLIDVSQQKTENVYSRVDKYKDTYTIRMKDSTTPAERKHNKDSAERLEKKRSLILILMKEFNIYWGYLEELYNISERYREELEDLQDNVVIYINQYCKRKKRDECIYPEVNYIRITRANLYELENNYKRCLKNIIEKVASFIQPSK